MRIFIVSLCFVLFNSALAAVWSVAQAETLATAVRYALTDNPEIKAATAEARASAFELLEKKSEYEPVIKIFGEAGAERVDDPSSLTPEDNDTTKFAREIGINAEVVLFDGYRRANRIYSGAARVDGNIFRLMDASETMSLNATEVYLDVYRHLLLLAAAEQNLIRHREVGQSVAALVEGGRLPLSDKLQVEERIRAAQLVTVSIRRALLDAEARYARIIGRKRGGNMSAPSVKSPYRSRQAVIDTAVAKSYKVRIADLEIDRAGYEMSIAEADAMPRLSFDAGITRGMDVDGSSGNYSDAFIGLRLDWTLYQGGRNERYSAVNERRHKALSERLQTIREVQELAERSWNSYVANSERAAILTSQFSINRQITTQYREEFEAGTRSLLDVLDIERASFEVELEKINAEASYVFSIYRILATTSSLAAHFGVKPSNTNLDPNFHQIVKKSPTAIFDISIPPLDSDLRD